MTSYEHNSSEASRKLGLQKFTDCKGRIAVIVSHRFGTGWSSRMEEKNKMRALFDPEIVRAMVDGKDISVIEQIARERYPEEMYYRGTGSTQCLEGLSIWWVSKGEKFIVKEYDGLEHLFLKDEIEWIEA